MTETRQLRTENYAAKRAKGFTCEKCPKTYRDEKEKKGLISQGGLLVCEKDGEALVRCQQHVEGVIRPHQWNEQLAA